MAQLVEQLAFNQWGVVRPFRVRVPVLPPDFCGYRLKEMASRFEREIMWVRFLLPVPVMNSIYFIYQEGGEDDGELYEGNIKSKSNLTRICNLIKNHREMYPDDYKGIDFRIEEYKLVLDNAKYLFNSKKKP